jgi:hypothetical protein
MFRLVGDASSIFINIRWLLLEYNMKNSKLYLYNGIAIIVVFFMCRILVMLPFWHMMYQLSNSKFWSLIPFYGKFICISGSLTLDALNIYWYYCIINIGIKMFRRSKTGLASTINEKSKVSID